MPIKLVVIAEPDDGEASLATLELPETGGTIGRNKSCELVLHDPSRFVSSRHVNIRIEHGGLLVEDSSSNGTYVNDAEEPIGRGNSIRIESGDTLGIGDFRIRVLHEVEQPGDSGPIDTGALKALESLTDEGSEGAAPADLVRASDAAPPEPVATGPTESQSPAQAVANAGAGTAAPSTAAASADDNRFYEGLLRGLGMRADAMADIDAYDLGEQIGLAFRECVETVMMVLKSRTAARSEFRLGQTQMMPSQNNPLKFSENPNEVFSRFFGRYREGYLGAMEAIRQAQSDIQNHETATLFGTSVALVELISRFDPEQISAELEPEGSKVPFWKNRSAELWRMYAERYAEITGAEFELVHREFSDRFARAYKERMKELQG